MFYNLFMIFLNIVAIMHIIILYALLKNKTLNFLVVFTVSAVYGTLIYINSQTRRGGGREIL